MNADPEESTPETLQRDLRASWAGKHVYAIVLENGFWTVHEHMPDGQVCPAIEYATPQEAVARLMQVVGTGPVEPQTWPERVEIGSVERSDV